MEKLKNIISKVIAFTTGYGFYGIGLLIGSIVSFFLGLGFIGWVLIGAFIGKNIQAIKEAVKNI